MHIINSLKWSLKTRRIWKRNKCMAKGGPFDKQTLYLTPFLGTAVIRVGDEVGHYTPRGYWIPKSV